MTLATFALAVLIVLIILSLPIWPFSRGWGFLPSAFFGVILLILLVLVWLGYLT